VKPNEDLPGIYLVLNDKGGERSIKSFKFLIPMDLRTMYCVKTIC
jgi:hypothetical protein